MLPGGPHVIASPDRAGAGRAGATKRFGAVLALDAVDLERAPRRGAGAPRRQRRRQVDADQVHQRRAPPRLGHDRDRRRAGQHHTRRRRPGATASRPCTKTSPCSTTSTRPPTSTPAARRRGPRWLPRRLRVLRRRIDGRRDRPRCSSACRSPCPIRRAAVGLMSGGQRQVIAVARAAAFASKVVILDEPTAALGVRESRRVLDLIRRLRDEGHAVIVISHAMDHVTEGRRPGRRHAARPQGRRRGPDQPTANSGSSRSSSARLTRTSSPAHRRHRHDHHLATPTGRRAHEDIMTEDAASHLVARLRSSPPACGSDSNGSSGTTAASGGGSATTAPPAAAADHGCGRRRADQDRVHHEVPGRLLRHDGRRREGRGTRTIPRSS